MRALMRLAAHRGASDAELGDVVEEYVLAGHGVFWFVRQMVSITRRRRSPLTMPERGHEMLSNIRNDVRYALRTLARNPGFAIAAILPIALGVGINTGVFALFNSLAWRGLPVPEPDALVSMYQDWRGGPKRTVYGARTLFSIPEYRAYRDQTQTLSGLIGYSRRWTVTLGREAPREIDGILVTCNYFDVLRVPPALGTGFTPSNCGSPDAPPVVVLTHALWQGTFAGDPAIIGKTIVLNGREFTVVGVAPIGFDGIDMARVTFFTPASMVGLLRPELSQLYENPQVSWMTLVGRRRDDATLSQTRADLAVIANRIDQQQPGRTTNLIIDPAATLSLPVQRQNAFTVASIVMAAFGLILLIASANVANILLARATARAREIAIRVSIGATRRRLVQQLLTESAIIACAGAIVGTLLFTWLFQAGIPWLLSSIPGSEPLRIDAIPDRTVLWFALGLTVTAALVFGLIPALQATSGDVHVVMKQDSPGAGGAGRGWLRGTLIGVQIALCTMLLIPAGLLSRALYATHTFDPGFDYDNVAMVRIDLRGPRYEKGNAAIFHDQWLERVRALPGVERVALAALPPLNPGRSQTTMRVADDPDPQVVDINTVSPEFFAVLDLPIVRGRVFTDAEREVALVNESTARHYWPGQEAIGQTILMDGVRRTIIGIVRDAQVTQADEAMWSYVYVPAMRGTQRGISVLARTRGEFNQFAAALRAETTRLDSNLVVNAQPLAANVGLLQTLSRINAGLAGMLSLLALVLATIGIYGVVGYVVGRRRHEIGVRMALGANAKDVERLILRQTLRPVVAGLLIGIAVAAVSARVLHSVLFGISPYDPIAFVGAPLLMLTIAAAAALLPTRRAMRVNPMSALHTE
jgi:putative ABC transport system permease protein